MALSNDRGAVTAEFMLLLPGLVLLVTTAVGGFTLGLERIALEVRAFEAARHYAITGETQDHNLTNEGRFSCIEVEKQGLVKLSAQSCMLRYGG